ncbi:MAG: ABC transporter ATP-binding protein [Actinomycetota bacterium]|nr:ABC transporter ATP-binding protein [Actinomycetota bacterium]
MTDPVVEGVPPRTSRRVGRGLLLSGTAKRREFRLNVDLAVAPGEVLGVLGPNGAGKTTLLSTLAGLNALTDGAIALDGQILDDVAGGHFVAPEHRPVGFVFQNYRLFPHLSVRDNVAFGPRSRGRGRRVSREIADRWLDRFGLGELADRKPRELSGGQEQRVALARALAADPGLLLLDEPLAALDARIKIEVRAELRRHLADFGGATVLVTHDPLEAMIMADRLLVIENGQIVQQGTPADVARRPATQYVARLVGLNLYPGTRDAEGRIALDGGGSFVGAAGPIQPSRVLVAIRPAAISVHTAKPDHSSPRNLWPGSVAGLELLTDRVRAQIDGVPPALVDLTPDAVADLNLTGGTGVWLSTKATDIDIYPDPN